VTSSLRSALVCAAAAAVFVSTVWVQAQAPQRQPQAGAAVQAPVPEGAARQGGGRGRGRGPQDPTPRLADGTVNFGRVPGEKGTWNVPYITNMAMRVVTGPGSSQLLPAIAAQQQAAAAARAGGGGARGGGARGGGGGRGGSTSEPWMPWMPWSAAVYDYNSRNESKYDPEGYCLPPGGPRMMATPYQMEIVQLP
jgi:hypothetical protein